MVNLVAAIDKDGIIGDSNTNSIPWHCAVDQELFRRLTWGADCVVGRRTWESLPESVRECEGRQWHVITSQRMVDREVTPFGDALPRSAGPHDDWHEWKKISNRNSQHIVIAGGASIYEQALDAGIVDRAFLTRLPAQSGGDVEWPGLPKGWERVRDREVTWEMGLDFQDRIAVEEWVPGGDQ